MLTGFVVASLVVLLIWVLGQMSSTSLPYEDRLALHVHPSDDQFLKKMPPGVSDEVALKVRRILVDVSGFEPDEIWPESTLVELLE